MPPSSSFLAPPGKRHWAGCFDGIAVGVAFLLANAVMEGLKADWSRWWILAAIFATYHFASLVARDGRTLGKTAVEICVVRTDGTPLRIQEALIRTGVRTAPFIAAAILLPPWGVTPILGLAIFEFFAVERPPARQTLADVLAGTLVVNLPELQPHRAVAGPMYSRSDAEFGGFPRKPPPE